MSCPCLEKKVCKNWKTAELEYKQCIRTESEWCSLTASFCVRDSLIWLTLISSYRTWNAIILLGAHSVLDFQSQSSGIKSAVPATHKIRPQMFRLTPYPIRFFTYNSIIWCYTGLYKMLGQISRVKSSFQNQEKSSYTHVRPERSGFWVWQTAFNDR